MISNKKCGSVQTLREIEDDNLLIMRRTAKNRFMNSARVNGSNAPNDFRRIEFNIEYMTDMAIPEFSHYLARP